MARQSANYKGDNEMVPRVLLKSPGIYLTAEEDPGKPQLEHRLMKAVRAVKWGPLPPNDVGRITQHARRGDGWKERTGD